MVIGKPLMADESETRLGVSIVAHSHRPACAKRDSGSAPVTARLAIMSERNGDRARFHKDRRRKLHRRQRIHTLMLALRNRADEQASTRAASLNMHDEGGPARIGD